MQLKIVGNYNSFAPLYEQYPGQINPQDAYITVDPVDGEMLADYNPEIGNAVPMDVWNGLVKRIPIPNTLKGKYVHPYMEEVRIRIEHACTGFESTWNGSNYVGYWPNWTQDLDYELESVCQEWTQDEESNVAVWDAADWFSPAPPSVSADMTNTQISAIEESESEYAKGEGVLLVGLYPYLKSLRTMAQEKLEGETL